MSLKRNLLANYFGQGWRALMGLVFVPLYIHYLGIEAYGLIGIYNLLQGWLGALDLGMTPTLIREMARFTGGAHSPQSIRDLLRSIEGICISSGLLIVLGVGLLAGYLARHWLHAEHLATETVTEALSVMGFVCALRFVENVYTGCMIGLQRQVLQNTVVSVMATLRSVGAIAVLHWIAPTIRVFFLWQGLISLATLVTFALLTYRILPRAPSRVRFSWSRLAEIRRFATGMLFTNWLSLLLTQVDRIMLSRLLTLEAFSYYTLANTVASALYTLTGPITSAVSPRFTQLVTAGPGTAADALRTLYHKAAQLVTVLLGAGALVMIAFGREVLLVWTGDPALTAKVLQVLPVLTLGALVHGLVWVPYQMQLAHGWTSLFVRINTVAVLILLPTLQVVVPRYGPLGAAWAWVALNLVYVTIGIGFMHRRILPGDKWRWYRSDVFAPLGGAALAAGLCRLLAPAAMGRIASVLVVGAAACFALVAGVLAAPELRNDAFRISRGYLRGRRSASQ